MIRRDRVHSLAAPVLKQPVFIVESDDWGPGPTEQAAALEAIAEVLSRYRDSDGHPALMTIGVVLSIPDADGIAATGKYQARFLDEPACRVIVEALKRGEAAGVFDLQLHGLAHYWPDNFMAAWRRDETIRRWLIKESWRTENLPPWLQSRWIDAVDGLPSKPLERHAVREAVRREIEGFHRCFGRQPKVVVPPTFVWDETVETAYAEAGVEVLITPGGRYRGRDAQGRLTEPERHYYNGELLATGLTALVRDIYFEPALGHRPDEVLAAVADKWRRREPALLETHRFNFLGDNLPESLACLENLLRQVLAHHPRVRFLSSHQLAARMAELSDPAPKNRLKTAWRRLRR